MTLVRCRWKPFLERKRKGFWTLNYSSSLYQVLNPENNNRQSENSSDEIEKYLGHPTQKNLLLIGYIVEGRKQESSQQEREIRQSQGPKLVFSGRHNPEHGTNHAQKPLIMDFRIDQFAGFTYRKSKPSFGPSVISHSTTN